MRKACLVFCTLVCIATIAGAAVPEMFPEAALSAATVKAPEALNHFKMAVEMDQLHQRLVSERAANDIYDLGQLSAAETAQLYGNDINQSRRLLVGVDRPVEAVVDIASTGDNAAKLSSSSRVGAMHRLPDGSIIWSATFRSPGARALRAHLVDIDLPEGVLLYVYGDNGDAFGPYASNNNREVWTNSVFGDHLTLQLEITAPVTEEKLWGSYFSIASVGHMGENFTLARSREESLNKSFCTINADCVENAACSSVPPAIAAASPAVADMLFLDKRSYYICTGTLVADTGGSMTPYFLTANHCIDDATGAASLETYFDFTAPCGTTACDNMYDGGRATPGAAFLAGSSTSDFTLMRLDAIPDGRTFLGWNATPIAYTNVAGLYRLSHPSGAPQAYSTHSVSTSAGTCSSWPRGSWIYSKDTYGATEGGSSGSAVMNSSGKIVGQLSGACGTNLSDVCDPINNSTVDGAFAAYFSQVSQWLDAGTCVPSTEVCNDVDDDCDGLIDEDGVCAGTCVPTTEICSDGIDNDCDGLVDQFDTDDCSAPTCLEYGQVCAVNADCCSDYCKGNRVKKCR